MRITDLMIRSNILYDVQSTLRRIDKYHRELSSGKKVQYPSDDAVVATRVSGTESKLRELEQYKRNATHVENIMESYDSISQEVSAIYQRVRELLVRASNGTMSEDDRKAIAEELKEIMDHFANIANTQVGGEYIFGGVRTDVPPVQQEDDEWRIVLPPESAKKRSIQIFGMNVEYGLTVYDIFKARNGKNVFEMLKNAVDALERNDGNYIRNISLKDVDYLEKNAMENFARVGAVSRSLKLVNKRIEDLNFFHTEYLSKEADADLTEVVTKLSMQNAVLQAALKSGAMVLQKTLVDFV
ncbi:MAG: flagellar hook-associated protein FlgL [Thermotogaceae bacterium]|nr:flagellar hook-associated protein FlgL [Thermotogaceae bacterium]